MLLSTDVFASSSTEVLFLKFFLISENFIILLSVKYGHIDFPFTSLNSPMFSIMFSIFISFLLLCFLYIHLVLPVCTWVLGHSLKHGKLTSGHMLKIRLFFLLIESVLNSFSVRGLGSFYSMLEFRLPWSCISRGQRITGGVSLWLQKPCHVLHADFHSTLLYPGRLAFFLPPLLQCLLNLGNGGVNIDAPLHHLGINT